MKGKISVDPDGLPSLPGSQLVGMFLHLMSLEIQLSLKDNEFVGQTLPILAQPMLPFEMFLQHIIVSVILPSLLLTASGFADMALFVTIPHMTEQFVVAVEP